MTDSVKLWALSESRLMARVGALQVKIRARARVAPLGFLEAAVPPPAHVARPTRLGEEPPPVRAAERAEQLAAFDPRDAADPLPDPQAGRLVDAGVFADGHDAFA